MGSIIASAVQGLVSGLLSPLVRWWQDRQLVTQGKNEQQQADLAVTVKEDVDARKVEDSSASLDRAALLKRLHDQSTSGR